ncbi:MAG: hypothetical protein ACKVP4_11755 [Hyphomicrobium sp.]
MNMRLIFTAAAALICFVAPASSAPANKDDCLKVAFDLASKAAKKKLPEAEAVKVEELVGKMEGECASEKMSDAEATSKQIDAAISGK